ncbi:MAG: DUF418 domain-containing protein [Pseudomonadota bacterium]|nr:DUF418 domain-containing protein [Pseudomonadota bacterium]
MGQAPASAVPSAGAAAPAGRIEQLDVLRGLAILGILLINLPPAATTILAAFEFPHLAGWTAADRAAWHFLEVFVEGTQRGLLQFLFGASMLILTARAMNDDGPVRVADLYYRRNLWLLLFGLVNIFVLLFPGDILFVYALAALFLFPFRRLGPKTLLALGLSWAIVSALTGGFKYAERAALVEQVERIETRRVPGEPEPQDAAALTQWEEALREVRPDQEFIAWDTAGRHGSVREYADLMHQFWLQRARDLEIFFDAVPEAFAAMLIGAALFKWGFLQGLRRRRVYLLVGAIAYAVGLGLRLVEVQDQLAHGAGPRIDWITDELARLATTLGHVSLIALILTSGAGRRLMRPFAAAGRIAFTLYVMQTVLIMWVLFPHFALGLWGKLGWAEMLGLALAIAAAQLVFANLWLRAFETGPVEWLWRSLVLWRRQPFRKVRTAGSDGEKGG